MKRTRIINLIALLINLGIVACFCAGFYFKFITPCIKDFKEFSNLGINILVEMKKFPFFVACLNLIASLFMMFCNGASARKMRDRTPGFFFTLRYMAMGASALSLIFILCALFYSNESIQPAYIILDINSGNLFFNSIIPLASIALFLFFELEQKCKFRENFGPLFFFGAYTGLTFFMVYFSEKLGLATSHTEALRIVEHHPMFWITEELLKENGGTSTQLNLAATRSFLVIITLLSFLLPALLWLLNKVISGLVIGYEYVEIDNNDNVIRPVNYPELSKDDKKSKKKKKPVYPNIYHVSIYSHKLRNWKVVLPNKEEKVFATQQEALNYASKLAKKSKGSVRIHAALAKLKFEKSKIEYKYL